MMLKNKFFIVLLPTLCTMTVFGVFMTSDDLKDKIQNIYDEVTEVQKFASEMPKLNNMATINNQIDDIRIFLANNINTTLNDIVASAKADNITIDSLFAQRFDKEFSKLLQNLDQHHMLSDKRSASVRSSIQRTIKTLKELYEKSYKSAGQSKPADFYIKRQV